MKFHKERVGVVALALLLGLTSGNALAESYGLPLVKPEEVGMSSERLARIGPVMQAFIDEHKVQGLVTAIARHGKLVHFEAQGYSNLEKKTRLRPDAIFRLYSMTKPVTAVAVMMAYEDGHFLLDDPVADYLPEFRHMKVHTESGLVDADRPITIRQLLTHTSGLDYGFFQDDPVAAMYRKAGLNDGDAHAMDITTEEYVKKLASMPLYAQPGTTWRYSDAMAVLGRLVEVVSGKRYSVFLKERLFDPLRMADTGFYVPPEKMDRLITMYEMGLDGHLIETDKLLSADHSARPIQTGDFSNPPSYESGGAGLVGTVTDYMRFAQMLLNGGQLDGSRILSPTSVKLIMSDHLGPEADEGFMAHIPRYWLHRPGFGFGFCGLVVRDAVANGTAGSNGEYHWSGAANTDFWVDREQGLVALVFTQVNHPIAPVKRWLTTRDKFHQLTYQAVVGE